MSNFTTWRSLVDGEEIFAIPDSVVDNFEWGGPLSDRWAGATGDWEINQTDVLFGDYSLSPTTTGAGIIEVISGDYDVPRVLGPSDVPFGFWFNEENNEAIRWYFAFQDSSNYAAAEVSPPSDQVRIRVDGTVENTASVTLSTSEWYWLGPTEWDTGVGEVTVEVRDGNFSTLASVTATDGGYQNEPGIAITNTASNSLAHWDGGVPE